MPRVGVSHGHTLTLLFCTSTRPHGLSLGPPIFQASPQVWAPRATLASTSRGLAVGALQLDLVASRPRHSDPRPAGADVRLPPRSVLKPTVVHSPPQRSRPHERPPVEPVLETRLDPPGRGLWH